ncbi:hypothetical protein ACFQ1M_12980 [Sungkyunkwania multivorans]|uniref:Uncharacterized protein n=1 Tax=Sungkyunkwania multivorans TaxID=1173618 RepID=A0ABW3D1D9_9FLAO
MKDSLFDHIEKCEHIIAYGKDELVVFDDQALDFVSVAKKDMHPYDMTTDSALKDYTNFKDLSLEEIFKIRRALLQNDEKAIYNANRMMRFLEFRMNSIQNRLRKNYTSRKERIRFIQNVISLLLEYHRRYDDPRFLSIALKLLRNRALSKRHLLDMSYSKQHAYNLLLSKHLIEKLKTNDKER